MNNRSTLFLFVRISIVFFLLCVFYLAFLLIGIDFGLVLSKVNSMLLGKGLHFIFGRLGWGGNALGLLVAIFLLNAEPDARIGHQMSPGGSGGSEASVNQPPAPDPAPQEPVSPEVDHPLLEDNHRRRELHDRLRINSLGRSYRPEELDSIVETQLQISKKIELALLSDGYSPESLINKRHQIRGVVFYPHGRPFSESTYSQYLYVMENHGTHRSLPYRRLMDAIYHLNLSL